MANDSKTLEDRLIEFGNSLTYLPSSVDQLYSLLEKIDSLLSNVEQSPSQSILSALKPIMKVLPVKELLGHPDMDVKAAVASCLSEITRITAPEAPFDDDIMKEILQMIVGAFGILGDMSNRAFEKRVSVLETVAKVGVCVVMLDLECDALILEMFHHFVKVLRPEHPENVPISMETIMTLVIDESEDISQEILSCLLDTATEDNQGVLPIARDLVKKVMGKCLDKLKPSFSELVQSPGAPLSKYIEVVASIYEEDNDSKVLGHNEPNGPDEAMFAFGLTEDNDSQKEPEVTDRDVAQRNSDNKRGLKRKCIWKESSGRKRKSRLKQPNEANSLGKEAAGEAKPTSVANDSEVKPQRNSVNKIGLKRKSIWKDSSGRKRKSILKQRKEANSLGNEAAGEPSLEGVDYSPRSASDVPGIDDTQLEDTSKTKSRKKVPVELDDISEIHDSKEELGENLVGSKIRVWWPDDAERITRLYVSPQTVVPAGVQIMIPPTEEEPPPAYSSSQSMYQPKASTYRNMIENNWEVVRIATRVLKSKVPESLKELVWEMLKPCRRSLEEVGEGPQLDVYLKANVAALRRKCVIRPGIHIVEAQQVQQQQLLEEDAE